MNGTKIRLLMDEIHSVAILISPGLRATWHILGNALLFMSWTLSASAAVIGFHAWLQGRSSRVKRILKAPYLSAIRIGMGVYLPKSGNDPDCLRKRLQQIEEILKACAK